MADVLTAAGWSVIVLEKGRNHLVDLDGPARAAAPLRQRRDRPDPPPPARPRPAARAPHVPPRPATTAIGCSPARSTTCRRRSAAAACTPTPSSPASARRTSTSAPRAARSTAPASTTGRSQYDDLEPHYAAVERAFGVAGEDGANPFAAWRSAPYPMPPGDDMPMAVVSSAAAERAGLHPYRAPTGANSVAYDGRPACVDCGFCGGYGCPIHAKGDPIASLQRALRTGRCEIRPESLRHRDRARRRPAGAPPACATSTCPATPMPPRGGAARAHAPSCSPAARSRRPGCCCATASAATSSGASSRTTSRRSRSASSRRPPAASGAAASPTCTTTS